MTPWTVAHQAPMFMEFSRQAYWSGLPFPSPGDFSYPGVKPGSVTLQADSLLIHQGCPLSWISPNIFGPSDFLSWKFEMREWKHLRKKNDYYAVHSCCLVTKPCPTLWDPVGCNLAGYSVHGISQARTGMGCHFLLQGIILTQGLSLCLLHCRLILQNWVTRKPYIPPNSYAEGPNLHGMILRGIVFGR